MNKPDCYKCEYRGNVAGSCHSRCNHPAFGSEGDNPIAEMLAIFAGVRRVAPIRMEGEGIKVVGSHQGIKNGWFNHPFNFDPTWLVSCNDFSEKKGV